MLSIRGRFDACGTRVRIILLTVTKKTTPGLEILRQGVSRIDDQLSKFHANTPISTPVSTFSVSKIRTDLSPGNRPDKQTERRQQRYSTT